MMNVYFLLLTKKKFLQVISKEITRGDGFSGKSDADDKVREHVKRIIKYSELLPPSPWAQNY